MAGSVLLEGSSTQRSPRSLTLTTDHSSSKREVQDAPSPPDRSRQNHPRETTDQPVFAPLILSFSRGKISYDKVPRAVLARCIEFVGNILMTSSVSKHFLYSSYDACQSIAKANKEIFLRTIITKAPNSNPESEDSNVYGYWSPIKTIHSTCIDQVRAIGIKVDRPQGVPLQTLIHQIPAGNFNLFFTAMLKQFGKQTLTSQEQDQVRAQQKLCSTEGDDLEKAKQGRAWMQENRAILQKIDSLDLAELGLSYLPPEIGLLTGLKSLNLYHNQLKSLPPEIGSLTKLKVLYLHSNQIKSLPREIGSLTKLEGLYLHNNQLKSLPQEIRFLTRLEELHLDYNQLESLPQEIGFLTALKYLDLSYNQLKSLPREIGSLTALKMLDLAHNQFEFLPPEMGLLIALQTLKLWDNQLESLPQEIDDLIQLGVEVIR